MSRIVPMATHQITFVRNAVEKAHADIRKACDDAEALLTKMAKDRQCDDEDVLAIVGVRTEIGIIRKAHE